MSERVFHIGIVGTFDVQNYGDLLFPILAEAELRERLGDVELHRFSYHARSAAEWPYAVTSLTELPAMLDQLDALLIGGGFLIRFDKYVADDYLPPSPHIHHPTGYWLTPALMALASGVPVAWNAPGMHCNDIPSWAEPLLELALGASAYVSVRDVPSKESLVPFAGPRSIEVVPDTAFNLARIIGERESDTMRALRERAGLNGPYLVVQPIRWRDADFPAFLKRHADRLAGYQLLALPIGPVLGDSTELLGDAASRFVQLPFWPEPALLAEVIRGASAVIGYSYHLAISALSFGVPVFTSVDLDTGKFTALRALETVHRLDSLDDPERFLAQLGRTTPPASVRATLPAVAAHWDRIAEVIRGGRRRVAPEFARFWQHLPSLLEPPSLPEPAPLREVPVEPPPVVAVAPRKRALARRLVSRVAKVVRSKKENAVIDLQKIVRGTLQNEPYSWAMIDGLFSPADAAALARSFPRDHFKLVAAYGGEKDYQYEARALIGMNDASIAHREHLSPAWQQLADDLLSAEYRNAVSSLSGCDLSAALFEVNVFHYGPGASLGAHPDLPDKLVTHVLYFNDAWNVADGGCLTILRSKDPADVAAVIPPLAGNSAVLVRSDHSWHAVSPVVPGCRLSRRSLTATFYRPGSSSSMWPAGEQPELHDYAEEPAAKKRSWLRWR